jgi:hypothetical protein
MSSPAAHGGEPQPRPPLGIAPEPIDPVFAPYQEFLPRPRSARPSAPRPSAPPAAPRPVAASVVTTPVVEQAKGVLALRYGVSSYEALGILARWARSAHVEVVDVARTLVEGVCQGRRRTLEEQRGLVRWLEHALREDHEPEATLPAQRTAPD